MSEYIKIVGDDSNTIIDDSYRNIHLIDVKRVLGSTAAIKNASGNPDTSYFPPLMTMYGFKFTVTSLSRPIIAMQFFFAGVWCENTTGNTWVITIFVHVQPQIRNPETTLYEFYIFGTVETYVRRTGEYVVEVFNAQNKLVYSSALKTMRVIDYFGGDIRNVAPNFFTRPSYQAYRRPIPNYSSAKKYAVVLVTIARDAWNMQAGGMTQMFMSYSSVVASEVITALTTYSVATDQNNNLEIFIPALSFIVLDVTDY